MSNNLILLQASEDVRIYEKTNSFKIKLVLEDTTITAYDLKTNKEIGYISLREVQSGKAPYINIAYLLEYISTFPKDYRRNGIGESIIRMFIDCGISPIYARNPFAQRSDLDDEDSSYLIDVGPHFVIGLAKKGLLTYEDQSDYSVMNEDAHIIN